MLRTASVAMAACNGERYIAEQIDSILLQLRDDDELIISYDESNDGTLDVIEDYVARDGRVGVIRNPRRGIVENFNNAIAECSNDVVFISDQDDIWVGGKRDKVLEALNRTQADLAIHNMVHVDEGGRVISRPMFEKYDIGHGMFKNFAKPRYSGCCMAFPQASKRLIYPMPTSVINYDHWIGMACEMFGKVALIDDVLLHHRLHGANATTQRRPLRKVFEQRSNLLVELSKRKWIIGG